MTTAERSRQEHVGQAERAVDRAAEEIGRAGALAGGFLTRFAARAREETEDVLAEAQTLRRRWEGAAR
jgi:hypothetical protein